MSSIDDPIEAVRQQHPEHPDTFGIALKIVGKIDPLAGFAGAIRKFFSEKESTERVEALFRALEWYIRRHEQSIEDIKDRIESPRYIEATLVAVNQSLQSANIEKIKRFAAVLGYEAVNEGDEKSLEDAVAFIRTLNELGDEDIKVLGILSSTQGPLFREDGSFIDNNLLWRVYGDTMAQSGDTSSSKDNFYSRCARLSGYGLVISMDRRGATVGPDDFVYRLTALGYRLGRMLST